MGRILLGVTGSVAAIRTPILSRALAKAGHEVRLVATEHALGFFTPLDAAVRVWLDRDEWSETAYQRGDPVLHIDFRNWAEVLVVAPLDANTLAKFALGLSDNFLTCIFRAWDFGRPVILAPAMNTRMWDSHVTLRHLRQILDDHGDGRAPLDWSLDQVSEVFARHAPSIRIVPPIEKELACGEVGIGGMAEVDAILAAVAAATPV